MVGCSLCGEEDRLFEAIADDQIKSVCRLCARKNNWPLIKKPSNEQMQNERRFVPVNSYPFERKKEKEPNPETEKVNRELKTIVVDRIKPGEYEDLIDNFHWHIQHARRLKKVSQKQLAEMIAEPEIIVSMAEKAQLPEDYEKTISKLEQLLGIKLRKKPVKLVGVSEQGLDFKKADLQNITTDDLRNLQIAKEADESALEKNEDEIELIDEDLDKE